jgi:hypothetical protein
MTCCSTVKTDDLPNTVVDCETAAAWQNATTASSGNRLAAVEREAASLTILDRVVLARILPPEGSIVEVRTCLEIAEKVELSGQERTQWIDPQTGNPKLGCEDAKTARNFNFADAEHAVIAERLKWLDQNHRINQHMLGLVAAFLENQSTESEEI